MPNASRRRYVFGPVPSRRLGRSLGVDLIPLKTCSFNCIYCQLGACEQTTVERREFFPVGDIVKDVERALDEGPRADVITFSGSGEPTLHSGLGEIADGIRRLTETPIVVLTNGSLFSDPAVRAACARTDIVIPSLDAGDERTFRHINRPHNSLHLHDLVKGLELFRQEFSGILWLEVFLLDSPYHDESQVRKIRRWVERIRPDRIHLNTVARPAAEAYAKALPHHTLVHYARLLGSNTEIVSDFVRSKGEIDFQARVDDVLNLLARRPCTLKDIADGLSTHPLEITKILEVLESGRVTRFSSPDGSLYYRLSEAKPD